MGTTARHAHPRATRDAMLLPVTAPACGPQLTAPVSPVNAEAPKSAQDAPLWEKHMPPVLSRVNEKLPTLWCTSRDCTALNAAVGGVLLNGEHWVCSLVSFEIHTATTFSAPSWLVFLSSSPPASARLVELVA